MVEVFKTNVNHTLQAKYVADAITRLFENYKVNFDLDDCDRILRIESRRIDVAGVVSMLRQMGVEIEVLPDEVLMLELELI